MPLTFTKGNGIVHGYSVLATARMSGHVRYVCAANKDRSTVNYRQSLAFDWPYLSCNDDRLSLKHYDWLLSKKSLFIIFRSSRTHKFFKTGVIRNFAIFKREHLCWGLIKLQALLSGTLFQPRSKETSTQVIPVKIEKFLRTAIHMEHLRWLLLSV